jgi:hypothetical protein
MSALAFTKSPDYNNSTKCIEFLQSKGVDVLGMTDALPPQAFHKCFFQSSDIKRMDKVDTDAELREKAQEEAQVAWTEYKSKETDEDLKGKVKDTDGIIWVDKFRGGKTGVFIHNPQLIADVCEFLEKKKAEVIQKKLNEILPQKSKGTGKRATKRGNSEFELDVKNTPETAQGGLYKYVLPDDEGQVFLKDGKIQVGKGENGRDVKPQTYKAVRKDYPFLTQGGCCGGITWDRAPGSKCLSDLGIKGAFVMGCSNNPQEGSDFCVKCDGKRSSVFEGTYKSGTYKGHTYAQVLHTLHQQNGKVLDGLGEWVYQKVKEGGKWIETDL